MHVQYSLKCSTQEIAGKQDRISVWINTISMTNLFLSILKTESLVLAVLKKF